MRFGFPFLRCALRFLDQEVFLLPNVLELSSSYMFAGFSG